MQPDFAEIAARRRSIRAYRPEPVSRDEVAELLRLSRLAPSGANLQPGGFHVLTGGALEALTARLQKAQDEGVTVEKEYSYFPEPMPAHLKARQRAAGYALYAALGIEKRDTDARRAQFARNYAFFGAPVGIVVTIERDMGKGCFMDLGMALMAFFLAAEARGMGATGIGALANYGRVVHDHLRLPEEEMVVCGMALGWPDWEHPANTVRTERAPLESYARFSGFPES